MKTPATKAKSFRPSLPPSHWGSRHGYWMADCPKHGETDHLSYLGGACSRCHQERLDAQEVES